MGAMTALIGLVGVVLGVLLGKTLEWGLDEFRRRRRRVDMVFALHAEISAGRSAVERQTEPTEADYFVSNRTPFSPADRTDFVFESLKGDLSILPQSVIHSVVRYYRLAEQTNLMVEFVSHPLYDQQGEAERRRYALHLLRKLAEQDTAAWAALRDLESYMTARRYEVPQPAPPARLRRFETGFAETTLDERNDGPTHD